MTLWYVLIPFITVKRNNQEKIVPVKVDYNQDEGRYIIGITQATRSMTLVESFQYTFVSFGEMIILNISWYVTIIINNITSKSFSTNSF